MSIEVEDLSFSNLEPAKYPNGEKQEHSLQTSDEIINHIVTKELASKKQTSENLFQKKRYVTVSDKDNEVIIDIKKTAQGLGISQKEVRTLAKKENAMEALQEVNTLRNEAIARYKKILEKYTIHRSCLIVEESGHKTGTKPETLLKVIQKGLEFSSGKVVTKPGEVTVNKMRVFRISEGGEISRIDKSIKISFPEVTYRTFNFSLGKMEVMKETPGGGNAVKSLKHEYQISTHLRDDDNDTQPVGIYCPREFTEISTEKAFAFYQADHTSGNLTLKNLKKRKFFSLSVKQRLELCGQLLSGLSTAHNKGIVHRNIKPGSCLLETDQNKIPTKFVIAEWRGAGINKNGEYSTPSYTPSDYYENKKRNEVDGKQSDIFATSKTIIEILLGKKQLNLPTAEIKDHQYPVPIEENSDTAINIKTLLQQKGIPGEIADVLISGLGPKNSRPNAEKLKLDFEETFNQID